MKPQIEISDLSFAYEDRVTLGSINLTIYQGEFIGLIGPNGGGKTTFLKLLLGLLNPQKGKILLHQNEKRCSKCQIAYVPQNLHFDKQFPLSLMELVLMGLLHEINWIGKYSALHRKKALEAIEKVGLAGLEEVPFGSLSGGQAQRGLFARALVTEPSILFLDEVTANIDPLAAETILSLISEQMGKTTIVMATHDLDAILGKVDRIFSIEKGVKILDPKLVCSHYSLYHDPSNPPHKPKK